LCKIDAGVRADPRVHRAFARRVYQGVEDFRDWARQVEEMPRDRLGEDEHPEYEDGASAMFVVDTIRVQLLPNAGPDTEPVLFDALLMSAVITSEAERGIAKYGQRAVSATLGFARSDALDRRQIGYSVLGWMLDPEIGGSLGSPLSASEREAAARAITAGLQEGDPTVRLTAIRAAQRGRVAGALPMLRVLAVTMPDEQPHRLRQAAADAVASLTR
jgi:hypothetical protein